MAFSPDGKRFATASLDVGFSSVNWALLVGSLVAALGVGRLLGSVLYGISATDAISFARALALVLGIVIVATLIPAWRAARTNPLSALRHH